MIEIRAMNSEEVGQLVRWAGREGWNPGREDASLFWNLDPEGFLALVEEEILVGGGAIIRHSDAFGFMGLFIVDQPYRGRKLGTQLWYARRDRLLSRLKPGGTIGMDGVDEMVPFYAKGGFEPFTRHRRFQLDQSSPLARRSKEIVELNSVEFGMVADFDETCFPARREAFLRDWMNQNGAVSLGFLDGGDLRGFGVMRPCAVGWKIGPLFADSFAIADALFQAFQLSCDHLPIFLDLPDNNPHALELARKYGMEEVFGCTRMYHGPAPDIDHARIFGVTTLEVG